MHVLGVVFLCLEHYSGVKTALRAPLMVEDYADFLLRADNGGGVLLRVVECV